MKRSQVTTKRGDAGRTSNLAGDDLSKSDPIIECVGLVDSFRAYTALVRLHIREGQPREHERIAAFLYWLLHVAFVIGSQCSDPRNKRPQYRQTDLAQSHLDRLEAEQAWLESQVKLPRQFIVSAANSLAAEVDVLTTHARKLERGVVQVAEAVPEFQAVAILAFVNRLSDALYMLARYLDNGDFQPVDYSVLDPN